MIQWKTEGTSLYQQLPAEMYESWKECEPLRKNIRQFNKQGLNYKTWNEHKPE
jgi:hypothetical protein